MRKLIFIFIALTQISFGQNQGPQLVKQLRSVYDAWRTSVIRKDAASWQRYTSQNRLTEIKNRILSERKPFPQAFFNLPAAPPSLSGLKALRVRINGPTVKAVYYGKVDFGVGGKPSENLLTISYLQERGVWKYEGSEFVNMSALPDLKKELDAGKLDYVDQNDFKPSGLVPSKPPIQLVAPVKYIAKAYVFCPGRQVDLTVNGVSKHTFQHDRSAQIIIGGAKDGVNNLKFQIKPLPGGDPKAVMTIRVYLMSEVQGKQPVKVFEYQVEGGEKPEASGDRTFNVTAEIAKALR